MISKFKKPVWFEGMALEPQHFQQWDRFFQSTLNYRSHTLYHYDWGFQQIEIDSDALSSGQFALLSCKGIFPDGLIMNMPDHQQLPGAYDFKEDFPLSEDKLNVYLAIPVEQMSEINCIFPDSNEEKIERARYTLENVNIKDDNTHYEMKEIGVAKPNIQILINPESMENYATLKIAEVIRSSEGKFILNDSFISTSLSISAANRLTNLVKSLIEQVSTKRSALVNRVPRGLHGRVEINVTDINVMMLLHIFNSSLPILHHFEKRDGHPEEFYKYLLTFAGQLTFFSTNEETLIHNFPQYNHLHLTECFNELDTIIKKLLLEASPPETYIHIPLERHKKFFYVAKLEHIVEDQSKLKSAEFYLTVSGEIPQKKIIFEVPKYIKIASPKMINDLIERALPGLKLDFIDRPPSGAPRKPDLYYFKLNKQDTPWNAISDEKIMVIYVPADLFNLNVELIVVD